MAVMRITLALALAGLAAAGEVPTYLWAEFPLPPGAVAALPEGAQTAGIPMAVAGEAGELSLVGATSEEELLGAGTFLFVDGPFFLLGARSEAGLAALRGDAAEAELVCLGDPGLLPELISAAESLGLLPPGIRVELVERTVSLKLPAPPAGVKLDPVLWGLLNAPDWFSFARDYGLERVGLRVRAVAEVEGLLPPEFEPYIHSSSDGLVELLLPIPLLDDLAREEAVVRVRPPYKPHPLPPGHP